MVASCIARDTEKARSLVQDQATKRTPEEEELGKKKLFSVHKTTTHNNPECYPQGDSRPTTMTIRTHTAAVLGINTGNKSTTVNSDDDFDKRSTVIIEKLDHHPGFVERIFHR